MKCTSASSPNLINITEYFSVRTMRDCAHIMKNSSWLSLDKSLPSTSWISYNLFIDVQLSLSIPAIKNMNHLRAHQLNISPKMIMISPVMKIILIQQEVVRSLSLVVSISRYGRLSRIWLILCWCWLRSWYSRWVWLRLLSKQGLRIREEWRKAILLLSWWIFVNGAWDKEFLMRFPLFLVQVRNIAIIHVSFDFDWQSSNVSKFCGMFDGDVSECCSFISDTLLSTVQSKKDSDNIDLLLLWTRCIQYTFEVFIILKITGRVGCVI